MPCRQALLYRLPALCFLHKTRKSIHLPSFPTVLLRRILFLRKHHPMDYPPFCLALRSLSSTFCTDCTVMSAFRSTLHSPVLSPDLRTAFLDYNSFRNLPPIPFIYYLIDAIIRKRTVPSCFPSCISPVSESDHVGFLFVR